MDENTAKLAQQLKGNPALLQSLMRSRDGQALMQMLTRLGSFDMEDILVNTWGFSLGFYAVRLSRERPVALACWLAALTVLSILAAELLNSVFFGR